MVELLKENPLLLLFAVSAIGFAVGKIRFKGGSLGVAAVLFVGLATGALDSSFTLPDIIFKMGLAMFVYTVGLSNGPGFFASFQKDGAKNILFGIGMTVIPAVVGLLFYFFLDFSAANTVGIFAGVSTNTAALASVLDVFAGRGSNSMVADATVGYSISYPIAVLGYIGAIGIARRMFKVDYAVEAAQLSKQYPTEQDLTNATIRVTVDAMTNTPIRDLRREHGWDTVFARFKPIGTERIMLANSDTEFEIGDLVKVVGSSHAIDEIITELGERADDFVVGEDETYQIKRLFVSNPEVAGKSIAALDLGRNYSTIVTRVGRGDIDLLAKSDTVLELGDRVRVLARRKDIPELSALFGDSYHDLSQINLFSFGLGLALGLLVGLVPISLTNNVSFSLGFAGGPLMVALILGTLRRTGPIVWTLPYSANHTLRQIGLIFLLAAVGVRSGGAFWETLIQGGALPIAAAATIIVLASTFAALFVGYKLLKIPFTVLTGMLAIQPAVLGYALDRAQNNLPMVGYTLMLPVSIITKVIVAQLLAIFLQ